MQRREVRPRLDAPLGECRAHTIAGAADIGHEERRRRPRARWDALQRDILPERQLPAIGVDELPAEVDLCLELLEREHAEGGVQLGDLGV